MQNECCISTETTKSNQQIRTIGFLIITAILLYAGYGIQLTYLKIHFFMLLPIFGLLFLPPMPLKNEAKEVKIVGYIFPVIIAISAIIFSSFWDNYIASKGVWTFDKSQMVGVIGHIPLEEYFWFVDHTFIASCYVLHLWGIRTPGSLPDKGDTKMAVRITGAIIFFVLMAIGIWLLQFDRMLFIGVILAFFCPVIGIMWLAGGHLLLEQRREMLVATGIVSLYVVLIDAWAVGENVWQFNEKYMTGVKLFEISDWSQIMINVWATAIVVIPMIIALRMTEILVLRNQDIEGSVFIEMIKGLFAKGETD